MVTRVTCSRVTVTRVTVTRVTCSRVTVTRVTCSRVTVTRVTVLTTATNVKWQPTSLAQVRYLILELVTRVTVTRVTCYPGNRTY